MKINKFTKKDIERIACMYGEPKESIKIISCSNNRLTKDFSEIICTCIKDIVGIVSNYLLEYIEKGADWIRRELYPAIINFLNESFEFARNFWDGIDDMISNIIIEIENYLLQALQYIKIEIEKLENKITELICNELFSFDDIKKIKKKKLQLEKF